jgi:nucleoside-diphosphate kinase
MVIRLAFFFRYQNNPSMVPRASPSGLTWVSKTILSAPVNCLFSSWIMSSLILANAQIFRGFKEPAKIRIFFIDHYKKNLIFALLKYTKTMAGTITFTMIKPGAVSQDFTGPILKMINESGFRIIAMKLTRMNTSQAEAFYVVHKERPFYGSLVKYMSSGPIVAAILKKDNAVADYRSLIGATNPAEATDGTIRKLYAESVESNAVHGSDSDENAIIESNFFFSESDRIALL